MIENVTLVVDSDDTEDQRLLQISEKTGIDVAQLIIRAVSDCLRAHPEAEWWNWGKQVGTALGKFP
jgi:hypothetical protein